METQLSNDAAPAPVWRALRGLLWAGWLAFSLSLFARPFLWHAEQFRNPGAVYFKVFLIAMPAWVLGCACYALLRARRTGWRAWELPALALVPMGVGFVYEPPAMATVLALALAAYGWGAAALGWLRVELRSALEHVALPLATGLVVAMVALFLIGLMGGLRPWVMVALFVAGLWAGRRELLQLPEAAAQLRRNWVEDESLGTALSGFTVPWLFAFANMSILTAVAPSRVFDVLRHHLFDAMMYAAWGALRPVEGVSYSYFPQGVELLMAAVLPFGGQIAAQLSAALFFAVLVLSVWLIARECGANRAQALVGVSLAVSVPAVHWTASVAKNDAALAVCLAAGLYAYLRYRGEGEDRVMLWGAGCLAVALHVKQPAIFGGFALTLLYLHAVWRSRQRMRLLTGIAVIALAIAPAYFARAKWYTGDAFYPLSANVVVGDAIDDYKTEKSSAWRVTEVFKEIHFQGIVAWEYTSTSANPVGAALVVFAPLLFLVRPSSRRWYPVLLFIVVYYATWASVLNMVRYILLPLCLALALLGSQFVRLWEQSRIAVRASLAAALTFCLLFGFWGTMLVEINVPLMAYFTKRMDRDQYLSAMMTDYASLAATVRMAGPDDRIHGIGNCAAAYAGNPQRFSCELCDHNLSCTAETIRQRMRCGQYRWLILNKRPEFRGAADPLVSEGKARPAYEDQYYAVYELLR
jgi:hypothetical protein